MKIYLLACLFCLACLPAIAQEADTTTAQVIDKENVGAYFGKQIYQFIDSTNSMTLKDVKKQRFVLSQKDNKYVPSAPNFTYWFKWVVISNLDSDTNKLLSLGGSTSIAEMIVEYPDSTSKVQKTGLNIAASQRSIRALGGSFMLFLPKGKKITLWLKTKQFYYPRFVTFKFGDVLPVVLRKSQTNFQEALIHGGLWMIFLYNLILLFINRDRAYFYYLGYLFVSNVLIMFTTFAHQFYIGEYLEYEAYIYFGLLGNIAIWYMAFIRKFMETKRYLPRLDAWALGYLRFRIVWIVVVLALYGMGVFSYIVCSWVVNTTIIIDIIFGVGMALQRNKTENKDVNIFLSSGSYCLFVGGGLSTLLPTFGMSTDFNIGDWNFAYFEVGLYAQVIIFSIGLSMRSRKIEQEKRQAQEQLLKLITDQNTVLEQKVQERTHELKQTLELVETERAKSDKLLLNILPTETAHELKEKGQATPKHYDLITVLFTDFKGFTLVAEKMTPQEVIENLNTCFYALDLICDKYGLEKIKTIGDSYMCAGGLPTANTTNPVDVVQAGLEMQGFMEAWKAEKEAQGLPAWELRLGIHSGEAVAGVVGKNKFAYDIWGDTVNLASRMESSGEVGKVNISEATYALIKDKFQCTHRGAIDAKNKGKVEMYFVEKAY